MNNRLRSDLARLRRRSHCYSKRVENLRDSLLFVFHRCLGRELVPPNLHRRLLKTAGR